MHRRAAPGRSPRHIGAGSGRSGRATQAKRGPGAHLAADYSSPALRPVSPSQGGRLPPSSLTLLTPQQRRRTVVEVRAQRVSKPPRDRARPLTGFRDGRRLPVAALRGAGPPQPPRCSCSLLAGSQGTRLGKMHQGPAGEGGWPGPVVHATAGPKSHCHLDKNPVTSGGSMNMPGSNVKRHAGHSSYAVVVPFFRAAPTIGQILS